jgi:hypothetical protein
MSGLTCRMRYSAFLSILENRSGACTPCVAKDQAVLAMSCALPSSSTSHADCFSTSAR